MNRNYRNTSLTSVLVLAILLCSIVCSVTNVFGRVIPAQAARVIKKEATSTQLTTQLAEKVESESDTKHSTPLFVIQTVIQLFRFDFAAPGYSGLVYATRFGGHRNIIPLYLIERTIRI
ncbi:MAG TPA: hypothetical protein VK658_28465 [Chryseolinea sp.]|nr:hypothetical protein [Chryseolinea sp.]